jgi:hypothetical protein
MADYFHEAGCLLKTDGEQVLLIARWGPYALMADGTPVEILRIQEWGEPPFGEWVAFHKLSPPLGEKAVDFLTGMENLLLLQEYTLDMENVWAACLAFASAAALHGSMIKNIFDLT